MAGLEPSRARALLEQLARPAPSIERNWKRRYTFQTEVVRGVDDEGNFSDLGTPEALAGVIRELHELGAAKELSFGERALASRAKALLAKAIGAALDRNEVDVEAEIERALRSAP